MTDTPPDGGNPIPANTIVIYVDGGNVQWVSAGPDTNVRVIIMDNDPDSIASPKIITSTMPLPADPNPACAWSGDLLEALLCHLDGSFTREEKEFGYDQPAF